MRLSKLFFKTTRETPRDVELVSHKFLLRGGFIKQFSSGVYGLTSLAVRVLNKIEQICRDEMEKVGSQEVKASCLSPKELWLESGRFDNFGQSLFKLEDRTHKTLVLNPTHEELFLAMTKGVISSYKQLPMCIHQLQTKFRDEARPRGGLIRLREFLMKDAYSFHDNKACLDEFYKKMTAAYETFYKRLGLKNFVCVLSDNGLMGGSYSHEFQLLTDAGEDKLISCNTCDYIANIEVATTVFKDISSTHEEFKKVETPNTNTISKLEEFLNIESQKTAKAILFETQETKKLVVCFVRGDLNVLESKVKGFLKENIQKASQNMLLKHNIKQGYVGPFHLPQKDRCVIIDNSLMTGEFFVTGANEEHSHFTGFSPKRDFLEKLSPLEKECVLIEDIIEVKPGFSCPKCQGRLHEQRGIEIGNIFSLGTRYSSPLKAKFLDKEGKQKAYEMGCYGIGITRVLAAIIEEHHDDHGPIFPITVSPYDIHICPLKYKKDSKVTQISDELYESLKQSGIEVLIDDSQDKPGSQFANADLIGVPIRVIISTKSIENSQLEIKFRDKSQSPIEIHYSKAKEELLKLVQAEYKKFLFK